MITTQNDIKKSSAKYTKLLIYVEKYKDKKSN